MSRISRRSGLLLQGKRGGKMNSIPVNFANWTETNEINISESSTKPKSQRILWPHWSTRGGRWGEPITVSPPKNLWSAFFSSNLTISVGASSVTSCWRFQTTWKLSPGKRQSGNKEQRERICWDQQTLPGTITSTTHPVPLGISAQVTISLEGGLAGQWRQHEATRSVWLPFQWVNTNPRQKVWAWMLDIDAPIPQDLPTNHTPY